ncbi:MAG TPA: EAL domain-containing protein [Rhizobiales bacterium]|nr:EAL domain-containing protein [Hyphomicrobiales bacterium]
MIPPEGGSIRTRYRFFPALVAGAYAVTSLLWILFSDRVVADLFTDDSTYHQVQTYKGLFFISASSLLIFLLLRWMWKDILAAYRTARESERRLQLALASADGGVWAIDLANGEESVDYVSPGLLAPLGFPEGHRLSMAELHSRTHPDDMARIDSSIDFAIASGGRHVHDVRYRVRADDGTYRWFHSRGSLVVEDGGKTRRLIGVSFDITSQMEAEDLVRQLRRYDPVTGLAKPDTLIDEVTAELAKSGGKQAFAVLQVRIRDLEQIVGEAGSPEAERIVQAVAERLRVGAAAGTLAARIAGDTFALATSGRSPGEAVDNVSKAFHQVFLVPIRTEGGEIRLRVAAGGALFPQDGTDAGEVLRKSGHALLAAVAASDTAVHWFTSGLDAEHRQRGERLRDLGMAVEKGEIGVVYQPLVDLKTGRTLGFEALARWLRPIEGTVSPAAFIPLAEEFGHIRSIGEFVLRQACATATRWRGADHRSPFVAVNVSTIQLDDPAFPATVARILAETGLAPARLEIEITESVIIKDPELAIRRLQALRDLGIAIAVDDFGTGYSSLAMLSRLPVTKLKIDRCLVTGFGESRSTSGIVSMIVDLCRHLNLEVTAEGIETDAEAKALAEAGIDLGQGFVFSRPVEAGQAEELLNCKWSTTEARRAIA